MNYRIAGFLEDPRKLLATRSRLRGAILDTLHQADIEIMSPMFVGRRTTPDDPLIPDKDGPSISSQTRRTAESRVFDKAEAASKLDDTRRKLVEAEENLDLLKLEVHNEDLETAERAERAVGRAERRIDNLNKRIDQLTEAQLEE